MLPYRNLSGLIILLLSIIAMHGLLAMTGRYSLSSGSENTSDEVVLGASTDEMNKNRNKFHKVSIFYHRLFVPN